MTYIEEETKTKYEARQNDTVLKGELDFNVKIKLDFPPHEKLKYSSDLEALAAQFTAVIESAIQKEAFSYLDSYAVDEYVSLSDFKIEESFTDALNEALKVKKERTTKQFTCSICEESFFGYPNNAQPLNEGECCNSCNIQVIQARINGGA